METGTGIVYLKNCRILEGLKEKIVDIIIAGGKITAIDEEFNSIDLPGLREFDLGEDYVFPGFIDNHVHLTGGGGESGFASRTPPINLSQITAGGVTTVVGCLGTDGTTRSMADLLAKARGLAEEGISTYIYTGSYQFPVRTLTGAIDKDIIYIDKVIGLGEIAIADHRSAHPNLDEFLRAVSLARTGGMLSGKSGLVNIHLGSGKSGFDFIEEAIKKSEIPRSQFLPTHVNRNKDVLSKGLEFALNGGRIDFTTSNGGVEPAPGLRSNDLLLAARDQGVDFDLISFSSDGQGSLPEFNDSGELIGLKVGKVTSLYDEVKNILDAGDFELGEIIPLITSNPAEALGLRNKGVIAEGFEADLVVADKNDYGIDKVFAIGELMVDGGNPLITGTFEKLKEEGGNSE
ncbi:MAG: beta-aspartyl-peptidase [Bacillota bacterium]